MEPITNKEFFLAAAAGDSVKLPTPLTREEMYLKRIAERGGGSGGSGGSGISVTAQVGQTIRVKAVDAKGIPTEWEAVDYQEKICGSEGGMVEVLAECQPPLIDSEGIYGVTENVQTLNVGDTCTVKWNGTEYACVAQDVSAMSPGALLLGDGTMAGLAGNGEPFVVLYIPGGEGLNPAVLQIIPMDGSTDPTIAIYTEGETIQTIPPKYLPEALQFGEGPAFETIVWSGRLIDVYKGFHKYDMGYNVVYIPASEIKSLTIVTATGDINVPDAETGRVITETDSGWQVDDILFCNKDHEGNPYGLNDGWWGKADLQVSRITVNPATIVNPMNEKYMPILTSPSGKKFKITVDDSGTISATEV
jgi:hypothetical protein